MPPPHRHCFQTWVLLPLLNIPPHRVCGRVGFWNPKEKWLAQVSEILWGEPRKLNTETGLSYVGDLVSSGSLSTPIYWRASKRSQHTNKNSWCWELDPEQGLLSLHPCFGTGWRRPSSGMGLDLEHLLYQQFFHFPKGVLFLYKKVNHLKKKKWGLRR